MDLTMLYALRDGLYAIKKEMNFRGLTFDEFLQHYDNLIEQMEKGVT